jgi:hypothetical protein
VPARAVLRKAAAAVAAGRLCYATQLEGEQGEEQTDVKKCDNWEPLLVITPVKFLEFE